MLRSFLSAGRGLSSPLSRSLSSCSTGAQREQRIKNILTENLKPTHLEVFDHSGGCDGGKLEVVVHSQVFQGMSLLKQHKTVQNLLADEIKTFHAFTCHTKPSSS